MTQIEFNKHYKEYLSSWEKKYKHLDLNFDTIMLMQGVSREEFNEKIKHVNDEKYFQTQDNISENDNGYGDVDVEDYVDEDNSSDGRKSQDYNVWIDGEGDGY